MASSSSSRPVWAASHDRDFYRDFYSTWQQWWIFWSFTCTCTIDRVSTVCCTAALQNLQSSKCTCHVSWASKWASKYSRSWMVPHANAHRPVTPAITKNPTFDLQPITNNVYIDIYFDIDFNTIINARPFIFNPADISASCKKLVDFQSHML